MIPTAEETLKQYFNIYMKSGSFKSFKKDHSTLFNVIIESMKHQNKLHVVESLKQASENASLQVEETMSSVRYKSHSSKGRTFIVAKDSILNSYPLENIK